MPAFWKLFYEALIRKRPGQIELSTNQRCPLFRVFVNWSFYCNFEIDYGYYVSYLNFSKRKKEKPQNKSYRTKYNQSTLQLDFIEIQVIDLTHFDSIQISQILNISWAIEDFRNHFNCKRQRMPGACQFSRLKVSQRLVIVL